MRATFLLICIIVFNPSFATKLNAEERTPVQKQFQNSLIQFLCEEGFSPVVDGNCVFFKKEGEKHWIQIEDESPFYLVVHREAIRCVDVSESVVLLACNYVNSITRSAKAIFRDNRVSLTVEMYCHSVEEFKYVFYKCISVLRTANQKVKDYCSDKRSFVDGSTCSSPKSIQDFFPVYGITLGKTTLDEAKRMGYKVEKYNSGGYVMRVKDIRFWDFDEVGVFKDIFLSQYDPMPQEWGSKFGFEWGLSYNQWIQKFLELGFKVIVKEEPKTKVYSGRHTLSADVKVTSADGKLEFSLDFDYGNDNGEGCTVDSANSLYQIHVEVE